MFFGNGSGNPLADRRYDLALHLAEGGDFSAAADLLRQGLEFAPKWPPIHFHLGEVCRLKGLNNDAKEAFLSYLTLDPADRMGACIKLALLGATPAPETMPTAYVQSLFDQYAPKFEKCLVENLCYRTPEFIYDEVLKIRTGPFEKLLDLGCGTGLAALLFKDNAGHFTGVDLAPAMIETARAKNLYQALHVGDIEEYLVNTKEAFDLILSADVFVYIGALERIFKDIANCITPDGLFAFSVQSLTEGDWILGEDHRYAHSRLYIENCANASGMFVLSSTDCTLRQDHGSPVQGTIYVCAPRL